MRIDQHVTIGIRWDEKVAPIIGDNVRIGAGAQIAGMAHVKADVAPGARMGGTPAVPFNEWAREVATLKRLAARRDK